jgi:hypothetical protein
MQEHENYYTTSRLYPTALGLFQATTALFSEAGEVAGKVLVFSTIIPLSLFVLYACDIIDYIFIKRIENNPDLADHNTVDTFFSAIEQAEGLLTVPPQRSVAQSNQPDEKSDEKKGRQSDEGNGQQLAVLTGMLKESGLTRSQYKGYASRITKMFNAKYKQDYNEFYSTNVKTQNSTTVAKNSKLLSLLYKFSVMTRELNDLLPKYKQVGDATSSTGFKLKSRSAVARSAGENLYSNMFNPEFATWLAEVADKDEIYTPVLNLLKKIQMDPSVLAIGNLDQAIEELEKATKGFSSRADKEYDIANLSLNAIIYACTSMAGIAPILAVCGFHVAPLLLLIGHQSIIISSVSAGVLALKERFPAALETYYHTTFSWNETEIHDAACDITLNVLDDFLQKDSPKENGLAEKQNNAAGQQQKFSAADVYKAISTGITDKLQSLNGITNVFNRHNFIADVNRKAQQIPAKHAAEREQQVYDLLTTIFDSNTQKSSSVRQTAFGWLTSIFSGSREEQHDTSEASALSPFSQKPVISYTQKITDMLVAARDNAGAVGVAR